jgi:hypothetical protein
MSDRVALLTRVKALLDDFEKQMAALEQRWERQGRRLREIAAALKAGR